MREILQWYAARLSGNRLPSLLQELAEAIEDEEDKEQLRRLSSSLREMGSIAANKSKPEYGGYGPYSRTKTKLGGV